MLGATLLALQPPLPPLTRLCVGSTVDLVGGPEQPPSGRSLRETENGPVEDLLQGRIWEFPVQNSQVRHVLPVRTHRCGRPPRRRLRCIPHKDVGEPALPTASVPGSDLPVIASEMTHFPRGGEPTHRWWQRWGRERQTALARPSSSWALVFSVVYAGWLPVRSHAGVRAGWGWAAGHTPCAVDTHPRT